MNTIPCLLKRLPPCDLMLGYGSGVFHQSGYTLRAGMADIIAVVPRKSEYLDALRDGGWISRGSHLMGKFCDPEIVYFAGVYLNYSCHIKLGVITSDKCLSRLRDWDDSFYIPGRLQKPVRILQSSDSAIMESFLCHQNINHRSALVAALLALPEASLKNFSLLELYSSLVALSYLGDIRMGLAENPKKVSNIVSGQFSILHDEMYSKYFRDIGIVEISPNTFQCTYSHDQLWLMLPLSFQRKAVQLCDRRLSLLGTLSGINRRESFHQAVVGVGTTGPLKSMNYLISKLNKRFS